MKWVDSFLLRRIKYYYYNYHYYCLLFLIFLLHGHKYTICFDGTIVPTCGSRDNRNFVRLNKLISLKKKISRRKSDKFIKEGNIKLNDVIVRNPGTHVDIAKDRLVIENKRVNINSFIKGQIGNGLKQKNSKNSNNSQNFIKWIVLHKPKGLICTSNDEKNRKSIFSLFSEDMLQKYRLVTVGRLDRNTSGVLLLTNEYEWIHKLTHPKFGRVRTYRVSIEGGVNMRSLKELSNGIYLEEENLLCQIGKKEKYIRKDKETEIKKEKKKGRKTAPAFIEVLREEIINIKGSKKKTTVLDISIREGRNHQIRKMFDHINQPIIKIKRIAFENITLKDIHFPKQFRELNQKEIVDLKKGSC